MKHSYIRYFLFLLITLCGIGTRANGYVPRNFEQFVDCDSCSEMISIPTGEYLMGAGEEDFNGYERYKIFALDEYPQRLIKIQKFAIAKYDVTRKDFGKFVAETSYETHKGCRRLIKGEWKEDPVADWRSPGFEQTELDPVVCVTMLDAFKYIDWINTKQIGKLQIYRLPSEEEWEYAARAATTTRTYWGVKFTDQCKYENTRDVSAKNIQAQVDYINCDDKYIYTAPVGSFLPNPWGLYDMLGNVLNWTSSCALSNRQIGRVNGDDYLLHHCPIRSLRGASWASIPAGVRAASRGGEKPDFAKSDVGFRLARDLINK